MLEALRYLGYGAAILAALFPTILAIMMAIDMGETTRKSEYNKNRKRRKRKIK